MDKKQQLADLVSRIDSYMQKKYSNQSNKQDFEDIKVLLKSLVKLFKDFKIDIPKEIKAPAPQITVKPPVVNVPAPVVNVPKAQPIVNVVERDYSESINKELKKVQKLLESVKIDTSVKNPLAVRLSDGEKFIEQLTNIVTQAVGGGSSTPTVATTVDGIRGVPVVNPDGTNISGGSGSSAYSNSSNVDKKGLVDADRHVQVDVLTMPVVTIDTTGLATSAKQDTIIGHVDGIEGLLTTIDADTGTLAGAVTAGKVQSEITNTVAVTQSGTWDEVGINDSGNSITIDYNGVAISTTNPLPIQPPALGYHKTRLTDGTTDAEVIPLTGYNAQAVGIVDGSGNQITSFGGGTQYTEGDTDASITGTAIVFESNVVTHAISTVNQDTPLPIQLFGAEAGSITNIDANTATLPNIESNTGGINAGMNTVGNAIGAQGMAVVGTDGTNARILKTDTDGELQVDVKSLPASALADTTANPTVPGVGAYLMGYNGTTWDRAHVLYSTAEDEPTQTGVFVIPMNRVFDGTNWDRMPGNSTDGTLVNLGANNDVTVTGTVTTVETKAATATQTTVNDTNTSTTILASNSSRLGATIANDSSAVLYLRLSSSAATSTNYTVRIAQYGYYEVPFNYTGQITGIWATDPNDGGARITELT